METQGFEAQTSEDMPKESSQVLHDQFAPGTPKQSVDARLLIVTCVYVVTQNGTEVLDKCLVEHISGSNLLSVDEGNCLNCCSLKSRNVQTVASCLWCFSAPFTHRAPSFHFISHPLLCRCPLLRGG